MAKVIVLIFNQRRCEKPRHSLLMDVSPPLSKTSVSFVSLCSCNAMNHTNGDNSTHLVSLHTGKVTCSRVKNEKELEREKFESCLTSHLHTPRLSNCPQFRRIKGVFECSQSGGAGGSDRTTQGRPAKKVENLARCCIGQSDTCKRTFPRVLFNMNTLLLFISHLS